MGIESISTFFISCTRMNISKDAIYEFKLNNKFVKLLRKFTNFMYERQSILLDVMS